MILVLLELEKKKTRDAKTIAINEKIELIKKLNWKIKDWTRKKSQTFENSHISFNAKFYAGKDIRLVPRFFEKIVDKYFPNFK